MRTISIFSSHDFQESCGNDTVIAITFLQTLSENNWGLRKREERVGNMSSETLILRRGS